MLRLGGDRLWNVYKIDDPKAGEYQWNTWPLQHYADNAKEKLNLKAGSYTILAREPSSGTHVFRVIKFDVKENQWYENVFQTENIQNGGLIEVRVADEQNAATLRSKNFIEQIKSSPLRQQEQTAGGGGSINEQDRVYSNDPMRVHGLNSIRGTMMEQRLHHALSQHRVHQFSALPENVQQDLKNDIKRYNDERHITRMENEGLRDLAITNQEKTLRENATDLEKEGIAKRRAHKISEELSHRFAADRYTRAHTHGGDLTENPEEHLQTRVHALFARDQIHVAEWMTAREKEFFGKNYEGGYLDTVETAVAKNQERKRSQLQSEDAIREEFNQESDQLFAAQIDAKILDIALLSQPINQMSAFVEQKHQGLVATLDVNGKYFNVYKIENNGGEGINYFINDRMKTGRYFYAAVDTFPMPLYDEARDANSEANKIKQARNLETGTYVFLTRRPDSMDEFRVMEFEVRQDGSVMLTRCIGLIRITAAGQHDHSQNVLELNVAPTEQEERIHFDQERMHQLNQRLHLAANERNQMNSSVVMGMGMQERRNDSASASASASASYPHSLAAPTQSYDSIHDALDDYDMQ